jgi:hypothetical protein
VLLPRIEHLAPVTSDSIRTQFCLFLKIEKLWENPSTMKAIILKTISLFDANLKNRLNHAPSSPDWFVTALLTGCFALCPMAQAVNPPLTPDPGPLPISNTADGQLALGGLTTGIYNSAFGIYALLSNGEANFNTGVGGATLLANTGSENTAVGAGALLSNTIGGQNTANGAFALFSNIEGIRNTAIGSGALLNNTDDSNTAIGADALGANNTGTFNVAIGASALIDNTQGDNNTAVGVGALSQVTGTGENTAVGRLAGAGITTASNVIVIGQLSGVHNVFGQTSDRCFIDNIFGAPVDGMDFAPVLVDSNGRLGTVTLPAGAKDPGGFFPHSGQRQAVRKDYEAMLNGKVEKLQATVAQQQKQIETLTGQIKEQAAQIQKVSAQLEVCKPAAQVVSYGQ